MNYCVNCKYRSNRHYCAHPSLDKDVVTGDINAEYCFVMRSEPRASSMYPNRGKCGPEGTLFELKPKTRLELLKQVLCNTLKLN